ncbi:MAG: DUF3368 domain-containing protein [Chloroflexaceae bacterium]|nr:DUF3368 domain-containing protein [Chloroflexaceae bacterium]
MIVVSNTSPITNLAAIGHLDILPKIYGRILIPQAVYQEIVIDGQGKPGAFQVRTESWVENQQVANVALVQWLEQALNKGESEAIALAQELPADLLLIDEARGRAMAEQLGLAYTGVLGILLVAKKQGLFSAIKPLVDDLIQVAGFWVDSRLYAEVMNFAGE